MEKLLLFPDTQRIETRSVEFVVLPKVGELQHLYGWKPA